jgi:hypothetical protein
MMNYDGLSPNFFAKQQNSGMAKKIMKIAWPNLTIQINQKYNTYGKI